MVKGPRPCSLSGAPCGCARLPMHTFGGSTDGSRPLLLLSNQSRACGQLHVLPLLTGLCSLTSVPFCVPSGGAPTSYPFGQCTLWNMNHKEFGKPHRLVAVGVCGPSVSPMSVAVCDVA